MRLPINIFALGITLLTAGCGYAPSDASIIARFNAHRTEFSQLLEMFHQDDIKGRLSCDGDASDDVIRGQQPISAQRRAEYGKLFQSVGCDTAVYYQPKSGNAEFTMWSVGMLFAGQHKSIDYFPGGGPASAVEPVVATTDSYRWAPVDRVRGYETLFRLIDGPWYLEYQAN